MNLNELKNANIDQVPFNSTQNDNTIHIPFNQDEDQQFNSIYSGAQIADR